MYEGMEKERRGVGEEKFAGIPVFRKASPFPQYIRSKSLALI